MHITQCTTPTQSIRPFPSLLTSQAQRCPTPATGLFGLSTGALRRRRTLVRAICLQTARCIELLNETRRQHKHTPPVNLLSLTATSVLRLPPSITQQSQRNIASRNKLRAAHLVSVRFPLPCRRDATRFGSDPASVRWLRYRERIVNRTVNITNTHKKKPL